MSSIKIARDSLVAALRKFSTDQVELWKQIPWLALQAEGISGYSDEGVSRYAAGYLRLLSQGGYYRVFIDLDSGEICSSMRPINLANDYDVLQLNEKHLNAQGYIDELIEYAKRPMWRGYDEKKVKAWREKQIRQYNLSPRYVRRGPREAETKFSWND
jgi:hypothetical protein